MRWQCHRREDVVKFSNLPCALAFLWYSWLFVCIRLIRGTLHPNTATKITLCKGTILISLKPTGANPRPFFTSFHQTAHIFCCTPFNLFRFDDFSISTPCAYVYTSNVLVYIPHPRIRCNELAPAPLDVMGGGPFRLFKDRPISKDRHPCIYGQELSRHMVDGSRFDLYFRRVLLFWPRRNRRVQERLGLQQCFLPGRCFSKRTDSTTTNEYTYSSRVWRAYIDSHLEKAKSQPYRYLNQCQLSAL